MRFSRWVRVRRSVALLAVLCGVLPATAQQEGWGTLTGTIYDPSGQPASGFRLVFRAVGGDVEFISPPSDDLGLYRVSLPAGRSYVLVAASAPDGTPLTVPALEPIAVDSGVRRADVRFRPSPAEVGEAPTPPAAKGPSTPWWKIAGPLVGAVIVAGVVLDLDDQETLASPSSP